MKKKLIIAAMAMCIVIGSTNAGFAAAAPNVPGLNVNKTAVSEATVAMKKAGCKGDSFADIMEKVQHYIMDKINSETGGLPEWSLPNTPTAPTTPAPAQPAPSEPSGPTAPTTPTESTAPTSQKTMAARVVALTNRERQSANLGALKSDSRLTKLAQMKAEDMAENNYFSHTSPTYGSAFDMMNANGVSYKTAGENIAKGQKTAESVMVGWMNSSGHRANILNSAYTEIGVGFAKDKNGTTYWVQIFAG